MRRQILLQRGDASEEKAPSWLEMCTIEQRTIVMAMKVAKSIEKPALEEEPAEMVGRFRWNLLILSLL